MSHGERPPALTLIPQARRWPLKAHPSKTGYRYARPLRRPPLCPPLLVRQGRVVLTEVEPDAAGTPCQRTAGL